MVDASGSVGASQSEPPSSPRWELSGVQRVILRSLADTKSQLSEMYAGALQVLQSDNRDRYALAAHNLRELMEKLPTYVDVPSTGTGGTSRAPKPLNAQVREFHDHWKSVASGLESATEITSRLRTFLRRTREFFEYFEASFPKRRELTTAALRKLDQSETPLPGPIEMHRVVLWDKYREFFLSIAHHGKVCPGDEFMQWLQAFENFLVDFIAPRTFDDFAVIDVLIEEAEKDA